jgi:hypothetical protein
MRAKRPGTNGNRGETSQGANGIRGETTRYPIVLLSPIDKTPIQSYCVTSHSRDGVNQMWILKNYKDQLEFIQSKSLSSCNIIKKLFDFPTL